MQSTKPRNYQDRPKRKKQSRPVTEPSANSNNYYDPKKKGRQGQNRRADEPSDVYYSKSNNNRDSVFVYRQDLLQKGFEVFIANRNSAAFTEVSDRFPECFNTTKRKVVIESHNTINEEPSGFSQSRIHMKEELREDLGHLIDNEEIPDWFLDQNQNKSKVSFDFGNTVSKTQLINKEISKRLDSHRLLFRHENQQNEVKNEVNFDELDKILEEKYIKSKAFIPSDEEEDFGLDLDTDTKQRTSKESGNGKKEDTCQKELNHSINDSSDYFNDLQNNIKKMLFNDKQSGSDDEKDSEESFQESLGFESKRENKGGKFDPKAKILPNSSESTQPSLIQDLQSSIRPLTGYPIPQNVMSVNRALVNSLNTSLVEGENEKELYHNDETLKLTPAEKEARHAAFIDKYGYLDPIICTLVYDILNSKKRAVMNQLSANGFNQKSVEKYCINKYKIFSLYMQGDIISKVWLYKDKLGMIHGPFMAYDMDIWNGEKNYFSEDLLISIDNAPFLNMNLYLNRSSVVLKIIEEFLRKTEELKNIPHPFPKNNMEMGKFDKKFSFHKKSENEMVVKNNQKSPEELTKNFSQLFPTLDESEKNVLKEDPKKKKVPGQNEPTLLETLRASIPKVEVDVEPKKAEKLGTNKPLEMESVNNPVIAKEDKNAPFIKKDDKSSQGGKKEGHLEATSENLRKGTNDNEKTEQKKNVSSNAQVSGQRQQTKKTPNMQTQPKETQLYVEKKSHGDKVPEKPADKTVSLDQEKTANIKNMLGLHF